MTALLTTALLSVLLCGIYQHHARIRQILDIPNQRSSHSLPTPHGGGIALLTAFSLGLMLAAWLYGEWESSLVTLAICALALMLIGVFDDIRGLAVGPRFLAYGAVCLFTAVIVLRDLAAMDVFSGTFVIIFWTLALLWCLNLYNFMDGIDGIAALETIFICCSAAFISWSAGNNSSYALYCLLLAAAHLGFFFWNYPPARLFMGDAGSVPSGYLLAGLALIGTVQGQLSPLCWVVLSAVFITDATFTLIWRTISGHAITQPHRIHAYQKLSRYLNSHIKVDMLMMAINVVWLFPIAVAVQLLPEIALILVFLAYLPLLYGIAKTTKLT